MSASLFYLSCRSQEVGESNASCLWSLHLLKRQKSKRQGNLKTTQHRHNPPPPLRAFTVWKAICKQQMRQPLRKRGIHHTGDPDVSHDFHMHSGSYMHSKQSKGLSDHIWRKFFPPPKKRGKFGNFTVTIDTQDVMKSARDEVSPVSWPWRLCLLQRFCSVFTTLLYYAHHLLQPFPYLLAHSDLSPHLTLSFHTSHSQFLFSSALKGAFTDC